MTPQSKRYRRGDDTFGGADAAPSVRSRASPAHPALPALPALPAQRSVDILLVRVIAELQHAVLPTVDGALLEPFERRLEQEEVVPLPHRVVRRAGEVDEDLVRRPQVGVVLAD